MTSAAEDSIYDSAIAVMEHLHLMDPGELVASILEQMAEHVVLDTYEREVAASAVLYAYNAIIAGAALAATVGLADASSA